MPVWARLMEKKWSKHLNNLHFAERNKKMICSIILLCLCCFTTLCFSQDKIENLPQPHYHQQETDPAWLKYAVQLHGHLGPMLTFGARMGMAALKAVNAKGYFDVEVTCEGPFVKPPESCFLDGIQISTGTNLGKTKFTVDRKRKNRGSHQKYSLRQVGRIGTQRIIFGNVAAGATNRQRRTKKHSKFASRGRSPIR